MCIELKEGAIELLNGKKLFIKSFALQKGELVGIKGANGSGKSTFLKAITGLLSFTFQTFIKTENPFLLSQNYRDFLVNWKTVKQNFTFFCSNETITNVTPLNLSLFEKKYPYELSGGERQLLNFTCALNIGKNIILLDEPFSGVDIRKRETVLLQLRQFAKNHNLSIVLVSHHKRDMGYCDKVYEIKNGAMAVV